MSIERQKGKVCLVCDDCSTEHTKWFPNEDFAELTKWAKKHKWHIVQDEGEYIHFCPDCAPSYRN